MNDQMNILLEVLEEIKQQNRGLKTSISNLASQPISTTASSEEDGISLTDVARLIGQKIEIDGKFKNELTDVAIVLGKRIREIKDDITKTQERQAENIASLSEKIQETQSPPEIKKYYLFDVKRWMEWLIWGTSIILLTCTIGWAVYLRNANQTLESYALRYRIIRMEQGYNSPTIAHLDSLFSSEDSSDSIHQLRHQVSNYELAIERQAELHLQQQRLSQEQEALTQQLQR
ncbi:hypothetical protein [Porphyromonas sp. COT-239 OH1446]|uniref:hypothetical protein n=1 Tax=Porphyromonas sp. COT-239 OH1446 TaxID=1515613 RepID=UPI00052D09A7|nr:hypothetical protein [Porphyromonas sp. COT-239 OH1446]KGN71574.1 hypothetical protein HQ37_01535 [Porphyromonas sp. COT-239 OH1446]